MRAARIVLAMATVLAVVAVLWVLGPPAWLVPPAVALGIAVVVLVVVGVRAPGRAVDAALVGVAAASLVAAIVVAAVVPRSVGPDDDALRGRTAQAVIGYLTVEPGAAEPAAVASRLRALAPLLTDRALADLRSQGPDAALGARPEDRASVS